MTDLLKDAIVGLLATAAFILFARWSYHAAGNRWARPKLSDDTPIELNIDKKSD